MSQPNIQVQLKNHTSILVVTEPGIYREMWEYFAFYVTGYKFMPKYKSGIWDGKIRLFNAVTYELPAGLYAQLCKFAKDRDYNIEIIDSDFGIPGSRNNVTREEVIDFCDTLNLPFKPHKEQIDAVLTSLTWNRRVLLSPTASGKSLIIYILLRWHLKHHDTGKILIVVPTIGLVTQMIKDFGEYGYDSEKCHAIFQGQSKNTDKRIIVSTWQSIYKQPASWFNKFFCVFGDECHGFKATSLASIMNKSKKAIYRIGLTGTLDGTTVHKLQLEGLFGPTYNVTSTKDLMDQGKVAKLKISVIHLLYPEEIRQGFKMKYQDEIDFLIGHKPRNDFIVELTKRLKGNTLILFRFVETHGEVLYKSLHESCGKDKRIFYVHGNTAADDRESVREIVAGLDNAVICASVGVFSTGINIPDIHNLILANPMKGQIKVLQGIGRILRLSDRSSRLFDIVDDLSWGKRVNYSLKHGALRVKIYENEQFDYSIDRVILE